MFDILHGHSDESKTIVFFSQDMSLPNTKYVVLNCIFSIPVQACYVCPLAPVFQHFTAGLYPVCNTAL